MRNSTYLTLLCLGYLISFLIHTIVNKYVLTDLSFNFPTVYQGWQNLVKFLFLCILKWRGDVSVRPLLTQVREWSAWPLVILYASAVYSGSVALSILPIGTFLAFNALPMMFTIWAAGANSSYKSEMFVMSTFLLVAVMFVSASELDVLKSGITWVSLHCACLVLLDLAQRFIRVTGEEASTNALDDSYLLFLGSALMFLPATVVLGEAVAAYHSFPYFRFVSFYVGVLVSGITGAILALFEVVIFSTRLKVANNAFAKAVTTLAAAAIFGRYSSGFHIMWCLVCSCIPLVVWYCSTLQDPPVSLAQNNDPV